MVQSEPLSAAAHRQNARRYAALGAAAGVVAVCAVVVMATHTSDTNLVAKPNVRTPSLSSACAAQRSDGGVSPRVAVPCCGGCRWFT